MGADQILERVTLPDGQEMVLTRWDDNITIFVGKRPLMSNFEHGSEDEFGRIVAERLVAAGVKKPRMLIGGLGLGYTLRAALDALPATAQVEVAELNPVVVDWCRGPAAACHGDALSDPRVRVVLGDVAACIRGAASGRSPAYDAIIVDLYLGPTGEDGGARDPLYGTAILSATFAALAPGGRYAVWGEQRHPPFEERLRRAGFAVTFRNERGGGPRHAVYLADRPGAATGRR